MSQISLRSYVEYIEDRLAHDAYSEVAAQCRHVLELYPKYIEVYKPLARALMEQENYQDALDLFQRVLSADPNDFVAHIGISDCYRESGALDQAIWHLERAFEQAPSNLDLQDAIKKLYQERDGSAPRKVQLTGGALARLYAKGKLYPQAVAELRKALSQDPERLDLQILLAKVMWDDHQEVEAGKIAGLVLKRLPNSVDANALLAQLWLRAGQPQEARLFLDRLREIDPYQAYMIEHGGERAPADAFQLPMLEYDSARQAREVGAADWVADIRSIAREDGVTGPLSTSAAQPAAETPDWLEEALKASAAQPAPSPLADRAATDEPAEVVSPLPSAPPVETPDWLNDALAAGSSEELAASPPAPAGPVPDWLAEITGASPQVAADMPAVQSPGAAEKDREAPDWLEEILSGQPAAPAADQEAATASEVPGVVSDEWLDQIISGSAGEPSAGAIPGVTDGADLPLQQSDAAGSADSVDLEVWDSAPSAGGERESESAGSDDLPDWLKAVVVPDKATDSETVEDRQAEAIPDWLRAVQGETQESKDSAEEAQTPSAQPDLAAAEPEPVTLQEEMQVAPPIDESAENGDSLEDPTWLEHGDLDSDDALAWLEQLADIAEASSGEEEESEKIEPVVEESTGGDDLPDWLKGESPGQPEPRPSSEVKDELPDWLRAAEPVAPAASEDEDGLAWLREPGEAPEDKEEELPGWLKEETPAPAAPAPEAEDALSWLDRQVADQGVSPDDELAEALKVDQPPAQSAPAPDLEAEAEPALDEELPDWLKEAGGQEALSRALETSESDEEEDELAWLETALEAEEVVVEDIGDLFEEEAPASAAEVEEEAEKEELPAWLKGEAEEVPAPAAEVEEEAEEEELPAWLKAEPEEAPAPAAEVEEEVEEEELPAWLKGEAEEAPAPAAEVETRPPAVGMPDWLKVPAAEEVSEPVAEAEPEPEPEPEPKPAPPVEITGDSYERLRVAREKIAVKAVDEALPYYENLIEEKEMLDQTVSDLTHVIRTEETVEPRVRRVLGDALRVQGRLQDALEVYRDALDKL